MSYTISPQGGITRDVDGVTIPRDITIPAYQNFLYWQQYGIDPAAPASATKEAQSDEGGS